MRHGKWGEWQYKQCGIGLGAVILQSCYAKNKGSRTKDTYISIWNSVRCTRGQSMATKNIHVANPS